MVAAVAVVAGSVIAAGATTALMIGAGLALAVGGAYAMMKQAQIKAGDYTAEPSAQTLRSSKAAARHIVGRINTGGVLVWAQEQAGDQSDDEWLHLVYMLSEGAIAGVDQILLDDRNISTYGARASYEVIIDPTTPNAFLMTNCPDWRSSMIGRGLSFVRISLRYNAETFPSGIPDAKFIVRGRTDIYDPRTSNSNYTDNPALIALWYLREVVGVPDDELVMESFIDAANICAESVQNPGGVGSSLRYTMGAVIADDERRGDVIAKIEAACGGKISRVGGRWMMRVGAYYGPADYTITEDMIIGAVTGAVEVDNDSAINTITGTFVDPDGSWSETDYPPVQSAVWLAEDGHELAETLDLKYVTNVYQAQRLADIALRLRRNGGGLSLPMNFNGYNCRPGRVVTVDLPSLNISGEFIVTDWSMGTGNACSVTVEPYGPEIYDDQAGREYTPLGFITLPVGGLAPPTGLVWTPDSQPEIRQGVLSWTPPFGEISYYGVIIRNAAGEPIQTYQVPGATSNCQVAGLPAGNYSMSVFARSDTGKSAEATLAVSIMGPPQPQTVSVSEGFDSITLVPFNVGGINGGTYEYFYALAPVSNPETAIYLGRGGSFTHTALAFNTTYYYYIRSVNAYGESGFYFVAATTSDDPSVVLDLLADEIGRGQLAPGLIDEIDLISGDGPGSVNERINEAVSEAVDALAYDPDETYAEGDTVRGGPGGRRLYQALQPVPVNTPPPNATYWMDVGQVVEDASGLVVQVQKNTADIEDIDGELTAQGTRIDTMRATLRPERADGEKADSLRGWYSQATFAEQVTVQTTEAEAAVERDQLLNAEVAATNALLLIEQQTRAAADSALAQQITTLQATVDNDIAAAIQDEATVRAAADSALAQRATTIEARMPGGSGPLATAASVQQTSQALADLDDALSSSWQVKTQVRNDGRVVQAGVAVGASIDPNGTSRSEILLMADTIAFLNTLNGQIHTPFVFNVAQDTAFLNTAFIGNATIGSAKFQDWLESDALGPGGVPALRLNFRTGEIHINSSLPGGGRLLIDGLGIVVYDNNDIDVCTFGWLGAR